MKTIALALWIIALPMLSVASASETGEIAPQTAYEQVAGKASIRLVDGVQPRSIRIINKETQKDTDHQLVVIIDGRSAGIPAIEAGESRFVTAKRIEVRSHDCPTAKTVRFSHQTE